VGTAEHGRNSRRPQTSSRRRQGHARHTSPLFLGPVNNQEQHQKQQPQQKQQLQQIEHAKRQQMKQQQ
jgi:hypothetical protein